ncbi:hypothetical protein QI200_12825, partial [Staphylococcus saprophyticus]|nr:hypothetical protein [Staphylococcus saprophyticus]
MAYEYETKNLIAKLSGVWVESEKKEILKELQEVYRKACAFDRIAEVHSDNDLYSDEYVLETIQEQIDE